MRGTLRDDLKQRAPSLPLPSIALPITFFRVYGVIGATLMLAVLASAGVLSGAGIFILMMIQMDVVGVALSSLLLAFSMAIVAGIYLWLTPEE